MNSGLILPTLVVLLGGVGTWLLLPHRHGRLKPRNTQIAGGGLAALAVLLTVFLYKKPDAFLMAVFFYGFALWAVAGAILTITSRNPVYSALWFASVILASSGLFLLAGAQFLAAGTVIVYAGAIIVTFLFVIMLAQAEGRAVYDRMARAPGAATLSGFGLMWALFYALVLVRSGDFATETAATARDRQPIAASRLVSGPGPDGKTVRRRVMADSGPALVLARANRETSLLHEAEADAASLPPGAPPPHVAGLGGTLFTDHLLSVELAGGILFIALVGAIAIATPRPLIRRIADPLADAAGDPRQGRNLENIPT